MRPGRIALGTVGLLPCAAIGVTLAQRLSVDVMPLQLRSSYIDERRPFDTIADSFAVTPAALAHGIGCGTLQPDESRLPLAALARRRGIPLGTAKQRIAETVLPRQFAGDTLLSGIGLVWPRAASAEH